LKICFQRTDRGRFAGDVPFLHQLYVLVVRSLFTHGLTKDVDTAKARRAFPERPVEMSGNRVNCNQGNLAMLCFSSDKLCDPEIPLDILHSVDAMKAPASLDRGRPLWSFRARPYRLEVTASVENSLHRSLAPVENG